MHQTCGAPDLPGSHQKNIHFVVVIGQDEANQKKVQLLSSKLFRNQIVPVPVLFTGDTKKIHFGICKNKNRVSISSPKLSHLYLEVLVNSLIHQESYILPGLSNTITWATCKLGTIAGWELVVIHFHTLSSGIGDPKLKHHPILNYRQSVSLSGLYHLYRAAIATNSHYRSVSDPSLKPI